MLESKDSEDIFYTLLLIGVGFSLIFIMLVGYTGVKIKNEDYCGVEKYNYAPLSNFVNSSYTLSDGNTAVLQSFIVDEKYLLQYEFCYHFNIQGSEGVRVRVVDDEGHNLGTDYISSSKSFHCTSLKREVDFGKEIKPLVLTDRFNLGLQCLNCNSTNNMTILSNIVGKQKTVSVYNLNSSAVSVYDDSSLAYELRGYKTCNTRVHFFLSWYLVLISCLFLAIGIYLFYDFSKREIGGIAE